MVTRKQPLWRWAALAGKWSFDGEYANYLGFEEKQGPFGLAISGNRLRQGDMDLVVRFEKPTESDGRLVFGYDPSSSSYYSVGIGGYNRAYVLDEFVQERGWGALALGGSANNIPANDDIRIRVELRGQRLRLTADGVRVLEKSLPHPLQGDEVGLFAWGTHPVAFSGLKTQALPPRAFVIMQFTEPFNSFHRHVIQPVAKKVGLEAFRACDVFKPGIILDDILRDILESEVIIAEITSGNPNVFYELGYAHALGKQTILLADRATSQLPFDIRGYRVIFYDDTIKGKPEVELELEKHLRNIMTGLK